MFMFLTRRNEESGGCIYVRFHKVCKGKKGRDYQKEGILEYIEYLF